ncbi:MAG: M23 family metallopeptidase [Bacteroidales bacterium]|nr:M23 family metallopeptidase [Bacteroidales bacterium]
MKLNLFYLLVFLCAFGAKAQNYINPMDIPVVLSASFAELRANHFHGGLDISTPHIGVPVKSVADGYVSRIKVSPYGYGYGLYITHYDGHTTVYGHLSEYAPKIDSVIRKEQYRLQSFDVDYFPDSTLLTVKQGEIVAYSGNTGGSFGPHLHLEVRDTKTEDPLNPLEFLEKPVADHRAPTVYGIKVYALDDTSAVNEKYYELKNIENKTVEAYGHIGFGINAVDFFDVGGRPCGVVEVSLYDNDMLVFQSRLDRMPFDKTRYINSFVDFAEEQSDNRYIQKSFVDPNNALDIYKVCKPIIVKPGSLHRIRYELTDFVGNTKKVSFYVRGVAANSFEPRICRGERISWALDYFYDNCGMEVIIPAGNFYKDEYLEFAKSDSNAFNRPLYTVGNRQIPVHNNITLTLPVPDDYLKMLAASELRDKQIFVARTGKKNSIGYVGGTLDGDRITVKPRILGDFLVAVDTVPPRVVTKNSVTLLSQNNNVMVGISDNLSGIEKYNVYIDGEWKIFEYDYKNARLISPVKKLGIKSGAHTLVAKIEDACGNLTEWEWKFRVR